MAEPAAIGRGMQGVVEENVAGMVKKITSPVVAKQEERAATILAGVDPEQEYTLYGRKFTPSANGRKVTITMPHGGESLDKFTDSAYILIYSKKNEHKVKSRSVYNAFIPELAKLYASIDALIEWLPTMHKAGVTHSDMGVNNLVWDGNKVRLID